MTMSDAFTAAATKRWKGASEALPGKARLRSPPTALPSEAAQ